MATPTALPVTTPVITAIRNVPYPPLKVGFCRLVEDIVRHAHPVRVIAFGSRARGTHRPDSDLDLAVIVKDRVLARPLVLQARRMSPAFFSCDLLVIDLDRQEWMQDSIVSVEHRVAQEGVLLYDDAAGRIDYEAAKRLAR